VLFWGVGVLGWVCGVVFWGAGVMGTSVLGMSSNVSFLLRKKHFEKRFFSFFGSHGWWVKGGCDVVFFFSPLFSLVQDFAKMQKKN
jgi:hypothetical protein